MRLADAVVYANARLAWLPHEKGLGYYPVEEALALKEKRQQRVIQKPWRINTSCKELYLSNFVGHCQ
jgi:hypothetical protein